ncbi:MAG: hypothetical protein HYX32_04555 [Actinobacteria bacterium]|nr:hypothetical protein [Actinomycetota bacterium]
MNDAHLQLFFERWMRVIPTPLGAADRAAGYWWELSMRQIEVSRTIVFGIHNLAELVVKAKAANDRPARHPARRPGLCHRDRSLEADLTASLQEDQRTGAIPSGDPRAMAWPVHSAWTLNSVAGFTNKSLRALVPQLLDASYNYKQTQMTFDLRRRRLKGLITRVECTNTCTLTPEGQHFAITYTKLGARVLPLLLDADKPPAPAELRHALKTIDRHVNDYLNARGTRGITVCSRRAALPTPRPAALGRSDIIGDRLRAPIPPCSSSNGL